jgi:hypothetical protein
MLIYPNFRKWQKKIGKKLTPLVVDIEIFWTEGEAGQIPSSGHELAIY